MPKWIIPMLKMEGDFLQKRIARLLRDVRSPKSYNGNDAIGLATTIGAVRKQNQDCALVVVAAYPQAPERNFCLAVLSDGMGGLIRGDEAAQLCVSMFASRILRMPGTPIHDRLSGAAVAANAAVSETFSGRAGATLSAILIDRDNLATGVNVGDSRIYGISKASGEVKQLSKDDTLAGFLGSGEGHDADRNHLVQYVGMGEGIEPHIIELDNEGFGSFLLTTDGVHGMAAALFAQVVKGATSRPDLTRRLVTISDLTGGRDNATVITIPNQLVISGEDVEQGLHLTLWSAFDKLEVWIPVLMENVQARHPGGAGEAPAERRPVPLVTPAPEHNNDQTNRDLGLHPPNDKKYSSRKKRKSFNRKRTAVQNRADESLPLDNADEPTLDVKFPDAGEQQ